VTSAPRTAIVTGAGRGIGRATAVRLAADFGRLILVSRTRSELEQTAAQVEAAGAQALVLDLDLRTAPAAVTAVRETLSFAGRIDALINIAGAVAPIDLFDMTDAQWDDGFALKLHGARRLTIEAWEALKEAHGSVVLTSGATALTPKASIAAIGTVNAAVSALAKAFSERGIRDGVQVNSVLPGPVMTDRRLAMVTKFALARGVSLNEGQRQFAEEAGISRLGEANEVADLIAFLVSPAARWMTGSAVRMDGGEAPTI
jgi:3-oxoacyl-[acyl-carrier protein] reductase